MMIFVQKLDARTFQHLNDKIKKRAEININLNNVINK